MFLNIQDEGGRWGVSLFLELGYSFFNARDFLDVLDSLFVEEGFDLSDHRHSGVNHVDKLLKVTKEIVVVDEERSNLVGVVDEELLGDEKSLTAFAIVGGNYS